MASVTYYAESDADRTDPQGRVSGWWIFAAIMLGLSGTMDVVWGIAAIADASFFSQGQRYMVSSDLHLWGWITVIIGGFKLVAGVSLGGGGTYGRWMGIIGASATAIVALVTLPAYPFWGIAAFALSLVIIYELAKPA
jgi:hypothetical protein